MKRLGFVYKQTKKVPAPLDPLSFVAQRAAYFRRLDDLRTSDAFICYHNETCCHVGEERSSIWIDDDGRERIRKVEGKGKRLTISTMTDEHGFHTDSVDLFTCDTDHRMVLETFFHE